MYALEDRLTDLAAPPTADAAVREVLVADFEKIRRWVARRCEGDAQSAGEIMAAFCLRALARAPQLRDVEAVRGWLATLLRNTVADHWRSAAADRRRFRSDDPCTLSQRSEYTLPQDPTLRREEPCDCLHDVLGRLRPEDRTLLRAIDLDGDDRATQAKRLGVTTNALGVRLHRARAALRAALLAHCDACSDNGHFDPWACPSPAERNV
jgi:RNA polymerase sigma-70 factor (ECF subfamily)